MAREGGVWGRIVEDWGRGQTCWGLVDDGTLTFYSCDKGNAEE